MNALKISQLFIQDNPYVDLEGQRAFVTLSDIFTWCNDNLEKVPATSTMERAVRIIKSGK